MYQILNFIVTFYFTHSHHKAKYSASKLLYKTRNNSPAVIKYLSILFNFYCLIYKLIYFLKATYIMQISPYSMKQFSFIISNNLNSNVILIALVITFQWLCYSGHVIMTKMFCWLKLFSSKKKGIFVAQIILNLKVTYTFIQTTVISEFRYWWGYQNRHLETFFCQKKKQKSFFEVAWKMCKK